MKNNDTTQTGLFGHKVVKEYKDDGADAYSGGMSVNAGKVQAILVKIPFANYEEHEGKHGVFRSIIIETQEGIRIDGSAIAKDTVELVFSSKRLKWLLDKLFKLDKQHFNENKLYMIEGLGESFERHYKISEVEK